MRAMVDSTYIKHITDQINLVTEGCGPILLFGENINLGSCLSGLARGLKVNPAGKILNVGNCELTHIGVGLGIMADGGKSVLFMKQLDFLLLGIDQIVNTFNYLRAFLPEGSLGSFTIYVIVCDQGYQGPQSSFNAAGDIASLANVDVFCLNGSDDSSEVIRGQFAKPGFRVVCVSQRLFPTLVLDLPIVARSPGWAIFQYSFGKDVTLVCYNFTLHEGLSLTTELRELGFEAELFHVNYVPDMDVSLIRESCAKTKNLVLIDDSKSVIKFGDKLSSELREQGVRFSCLSLLRRGCKNQDYGVAEDRFIPDVDAVRDFLLIRDEKSNGPSV